jgi:phage-related protein
MKARDGIARAIYIAQTGKQLVPLHVFIKKTEKTPRKAFRTATERQQRINNE